MIPDYADIPIFPLPNVTFFPQTYLPLHIFEPRYRAMVASALGGDKLIGVTLLKNGWQKDYFGRPPVCKTFSVGKIVHHEELNGGKYNITLQGLWRVRLVEEFHTQSFRVGRVHVLQEPPIDAARETVSELMKQVHELTRALMRQLPQMRQVIADAFAAHPHPLVTVSHLTSSLVIDAYDRQSILEQDDPVRRIRLLIVQLQSIIQQLQGERVSEELIEEDDH